MQRVPGEKYNIFHHFPRDKSSSSKIPLAKVQVDCRRSVYLLIAGNFSCMGIYELAGDDMQFCPRIPLLHFTMKLLIL